jgi:hypothetical protein
MEVHVIYNPNRWLANAKAGSAEVRVHRAGCRDIAKEKRGATSDYSTAGDSQREIAEDFWSDFIAEESMTAEDAMQFTDFMPCCADLPLDEAPKPSRSEAKADLARRMIMAVSDVLRTSDGSECFRSGLSHGEAAQMAANWLAHLPAGKDGDGPWWPESLPRPTAKRWG